MSDIGRSKARGGIAPFGYRWKDGELVVDSDEAPVRSLMYELFLKHRRKKTVAKLLNDLGHRTRSASHFSDTTVGRLLRDTTAKGMRQIDGNVINVEPIVSVELWESVNMLLDSRKPPKQSIHLFSGFLYCDCGGKMVVPSNSTKYVCVSCRRKILLTDLEEVFHLRIGGLNDAEYGSMHRQWHLLSQKEKRIIVEHICEKVIVRKDLIRFDLSYGPAESKDGSIEDGRTLEGPVEESSPIVDSRAILLEEPLLSEAKAAEFLGISKMTILRRRQQGEIGHFRVGARVLYSKEKHLRPYLEEHEKPRS